MKEDAPKGHWGKNQLKAPAAINRSQRCLRADGNPTLSHQAGRRTTQFRVKSTRKPAGNILFLSFFHSCIHLFMYSFIHSFIHLCVQSFNNDSLIPGTLLLIYSREAEINEMHSYLPGALALFANR